MPNYEYKCNPCMRIDVKYHPMSETPSIECPNCGNNMYRYFGNQKVRFNKPMEEFLDISGETPRMITSEKQIKEIEKTENKVLAGHKEISQEAKKNKKQVAEDMSKQRKKSLWKEAIRISKMAGPDEWSEKCIGVNRKS